MNYSWPYDLLLLLYVLTFKINLHNNFDMGSTNRKKPNTHPPPPPLPQSEELHM